MIGQDPSKWLSGAVDGEQSLGVATMVYQACHYGSRVYPAG